MLKAHTPLQSETVSDKAGRILHLIDLENLVGSADFSREEAARVHRGYVQVAPFGAIDQIVLATSHHAAAPAWFGWPATARRLVRSGQNGADLALLRVLACESVATRFDRVVIGSGDGIFAYEAARLQAAGVAVAVVALHAALSRQLGFAVRDVRYLEPLEIAPVIALRLGNA
jgi:NYN domain